MNYNVSIKKYSHCSIDLLILFHSHFIPQPPQILFNLCFQLCTFFKLCFQLGTELLHLFGKGDPIIFSLRSSNIAAGSEDIIVLSDLLQRGRFAISCNIFIILSTLPAAEGLGYFLYLRSLKISSYTISHVSFFAGINEEDFARTVIKACFTIRHTPESPLKRGLFSFLVFSQEPDAGGNLRIGK